MEICLRDPKRLCNINIGLDILCPRSLWARKSMPKVHTGTTNSARGPRGLYNIALEHRNLCPRSVWAQQSGLLFSWLVLIAATLHSSFRNYSLKLITQASERKTSRFALGTGGPRKPHERQREKSLLLNGSGGTKFGTT